MDQIMQNQDDDYEETLVYHSRMQYLKREGCKRNSVNSTNNKQRRRMSTYDIFDDNLPSLSQEQLQPCSRDILLPPNELMTRTQSFRHAYWEHHFQPTTRNIKQIFPKVNERTERLSKKRKEIIAKLQAHEKARREAELKRRAERLLAQQNNTKVESDSDDDSDESDSVRNESIANSIMRSTMVGTTRTRKDDEPGLEQKGQTICVPTVNHHHAAATSTTDAESNDFTAGFAFSFLSEWANEDKR
eukprot:scaffold31226_cov153-Skeletonema_marinoi.AAC.1